ncbi:MAG: phosphorylase [Deltaproteobacteria bacterium]|nr:phosphorylase [Deltaproteobacteria bacterium]
MFRRRRHAWRPADGAAQEPIRSEIFSQARLEAHAESLAAAQSVTADPIRGQEIAPRLAENRRVLETAYDLLLEAVAAQRAVTPAAEWLIDNFHVVRAQLKDIHDHLPAHFYRELPKLADGPLQGFPRVYGITWAFVAHTDSRFDPDLLKHFLLAYQRVQSLTIGELWAVAITLRAVLIENLRRHAVLIVDAQLARKEADRLADEVLGLGATPARPIAQLIVALEQIHFSRAFAVQLLQRLRFQDAAIDPLLEWLYTRLSQDGLVADEVVSAEHNSQTAANETVRNIMTSARLISVFDWQTFFEAVSLVEAVLRTHPGYCRMDFTSRDRYRHGLEELARFAPLSELAVARLVMAKVAAAQQALDTGAPASALQIRATDPGYYLISAGRVPLECEIGGTPRWSQRAIRWLRGHAGPLFIGSIVTLTVGLVAIAALLGPLAGPLWLLSLLSLLPASEISVAVTNRLVAALMGPRYLPRLNLEAGIPAALKTCVVVPTFLMTREQITAQVEQLETYYLANPDEHLRFALLTDWTDAPVEHTTADELLLHHAIATVQQLNARFGPTASSEDRFYLFHRRRRFNPQQGQWMGWERKRGKLHEFNRLLQGARDTSHLPTDGATLAVPSAVRYVITLDADTKLPRGAAAHLIGTLAHPLNQAHVDPHTHRVTHGYGILQPRITPSLPATAESTIFQRISAGPSGIDPYASAISDVYQDLFDEGSYTGKGIYEVATFEAVLAHRAPENALLSHDLFEGNFVRCGFVSDIEFFEDFPSHAGVAAQRTHRWVRGDWQLLPWLVGPRGRAIPLIGRWKMWDNLRRSLVPPATLAFIVLALMLPQIHVARWLVMALSSLFVPAILVFLTDIVPTHRIPSLWHHFLGTSRDFALGIERSLLNLILLPYHASVAIDAIGRTLFRLIISRRNLLEWRTAAQTQSTAGLSATSFWIGMRGALLWTACAAAAILWGQHAEPSVTLYCAVVLLLLWGASPAIAHWLSSPPTVRPLVPVQPEDIQLLTTAARRIWRFFTTFVTAEEHFLPPDNFQEDPQPVVAHRSSPTNFGLYLLSVVAARDFGWIGTMEMAERLHNTLKSLLALPKYQGHFFNWYDTLSAQPLEPKYISSVDNGNLAGHLIAVAQGCLERLAAPVQLATVPDGIRATLSLVQDAAAHGGAHISDQQRGASDLTQQLDTLGQQLMTPPRGGNQLGYWHALLTQSRAVVASAKQMAAATADDHNRELVAWTRALKNDIDSAARDVVTLLAWTEDIADTSATPESSDDSSRRHTLHAALATPVALRDLPAHCESVIEMLLHWRRSNQSTQRLVPPFLEPLLETLEHTIVNARETIRLLTDAHQFCHRLFREMDFAMLYDPVRKLFSIGLRVGDHTLDAGYYDLLASEARLTSFIAIAKGDVPVAHWFRLGRTLTAVHHGAALVSWSGSMFEYLMPSLVMQTPRGSLLEQTCAIVVRTQIDYGDSHHVPWGISESAYHKRDAHLTYQYSNFGIPALGLKRGLGADLVVAPYATFLAALFDAGAAAANLRRLERKGASGPYGFYEALDFTAARLPPDQPFAVIKAYMAHHQGMALVALANVFGDGAMQRRFHADPLIQATELLLQERTPRNVGTIQPNNESFQLAIVRDSASPVVRIYHRPNSPIPYTQLLSDGQYSVMVTSAGSGFSRYNELALTRWREDVTQDHWGSYCYLKDTDSGRVWSATYQPTGVVADQYEVHFTEDRARFSREDDGIVCALEIYISPEDSAEIRQLTLTNTGSDTRTIEVTSYAEIVLNTQAADVAHPAFSNLFVQTEFVPALNALVATRRPRTADAATPWMAQVLLDDARVCSPTTYETDRARFLGRSRSARDPQAVYDNQPLTNTVGAVLDPIFSLRTTVRLEPGVPVHLTWSTCVAPTREELLDRAEKFRDPATFERLTNLAWTQAQVKLHYLNIEPVEAHQFQRLATRLLYSDMSLRPSSDVLKRNTKDVTGLWAHSISGDLPIVLLRIDDIEERNIVRQLLKAQEYLATKRLSVDLVILNEKAHSYSQELHNALEAMVHSSRGVGHSPLPQSLGKVFLLRADLLPAADLDLLSAAARATFSSHLGSLTEQVTRMRQVIPTPPTRHQRRLPVRTGTTLPLPTLEFFNGLGGFTADGREYVIVLTGRDTTPAPWINVLANEHFGFQVSESGSGYTWSGNSRENQLTPWSNDPVCDPSGETFYLRDRDSGALWSPTAHPIRLPDTVYLARHGQGYSRFELQAHGIHSELTQFVAGDAPAKVSQLCLTNHSSKTRRLTITAYVEWVLGFSRATMAPSTITAYDESLDAVVAHNVRSREYGERIAWFTLLHQPFSYTGDRTEFIGRNGTLREPVGLFHTDGLSGQVGAGLDPCAALQTDIELAPGATLQLCFVLGQAEDRAAAHVALTALRSRDAGEILQQVVASWDQLLGAVQIDTPDRALNFMMNRWWLYQTLVCRVWARSAFYQAGGAFGFRDQLQDVMALTLARPELARNQIVRAAGRQFIAGDVQHWWHPPTGCGVRTHFSDDLLWLPYVTAHYVAVTGDTAVLDTDIAFLDAPPLPREQEDAYGTPTVSAHTASLYEHCALTLDRSLTVGRHGLPLMGGGDWNDGMNRVGHQGQGESVWLAWFLYANLTQFATLAAQRGDSERATRWRMHAAQLQHAVEAKGWDGAWYRRAFYDDGTPLGTASDHECRIDSLAQTWAVISGAADQAHAAQAIDSLEQMLHRPADQLALLFTPPFDTTPRDPGYIKGYLPGVRENGGQYTHAAAWSVIALAQLGRGDRAVELLSWLNPVHHALTRAAAERYTIEPYVLAGDVYSEPPHTGRGGWSWYTGAAGWMYRATLEYVLGFRVHGNTLCLAPCRTTVWPQCTITYRHGTATYTIHLTHAPAAANATPHTTLDGQPVAHPHHIPLQDDGRAHTIHCVLAGPSELP